MTFNPWLELTDPAKADSVIRAATNALLEAESATVAAVHAVAVAKNESSAFDAIEKARDLLDGLHKAVLNDRLAHDYRGELDTANDDLEAGAEAIMNAIGVDRDTAGDVIRVAASGLAKVNRRGEGWQYDFDRCWQRGGVRYWFEFHAEDGRLYLVAAETSS
jgi:hypothetical protein